MNTVAVNCCFVVNASIVVARVVVDAAVADWVILTFAENNSPPPRGWMSCFHEV